MVNIHITAKDKGCNDKGELGMRKSRVYPSTLARTIYDFECHLFVKMQWIQWRMNLQNAIGSKTSFWLNFLGAGLTEFVQGLHAQDINWVRSSLAIQSYEQSLPCYSLWGPWHFESSFSNGPTTCSQVDDHQNHVSGPGHGSEDEPVTCPSPMEEAVSCQHLRHHLHRRGGWMQRVNQLSPLWRPGSNASSLVSRSGKPITRSSSKRLRTMRRRSGR